MPKDTWGIGSVVVIVVVIVAVFMLPIYAPVHNMRGFLSRVHGWAYRGQAGAA
jgi:hypothetical protein